MAALDPAFRSVEKTKSGFHVWRIEAMKVVPVPRDQWGSFYSGDSYIVLSKRESGSRAGRGAATQAKEVKGPLDIHIHFWLGKDTSDDEAGVAAYKTVELDDYLGGSPVQHREIQNHESPMFQSYFKPQIKYLQGGVASGFNHVEVVIQERLLHVKGKRYVRMTEVPLAWSSMNSGDVFILDLGRAVFIWQGKDCNRLEKLRATQIAKDVSEERTNQLDKKVPVIIVEDEREHTMTPDQLELWNEHLPLKEKSVQTAEEAGSDDRVARAAAGSMKLYSCSDESGTLKVQEVKTGPLQQEDLNSNDVFIVDNGPAGIWAWIGKKASKKERSEAMRNAMFFGKKKDYPPETPVQRVIDGGEPAEFKALFRSWKVKGASVGLGRTYSHNKIAKTVQTKFDVASMHEQPQVAASTGMVDDGTGPLEVWRIENFEMKPLDKKYFGTFFGGDCYVLLYTYTHAGRDRRIIYYWQGLKSTIDERGTSALKAKELDDKYGGEPIQIRVVQNKEPPHFMSMFDGKMVVFEGGKAGWSKGAQDEGPGDSYLLQVRGTTKLNCKAVQVDKRAASLNSNDCFVLFTKTAVFIWCGKGCTGDEREMAKMIGKLGPREPQMVFEGQEKDDFWKAIGGKEEYASDKRLADDSVAQPARLFQCSNASGRFSVEEIPDFAQQDLVEDDIMLLDAWETIFLWQGAGANKAEKDASLVAAQEYIATDPAGRDKDTPIALVKQGYEPPTFTGFFGAWDNDMWSKGKTYEELCQEIGDSQAGVELVTKSMNGQSLSVHEVRKFSLAELQQPMDDLPSGVDAAHREVHLSEADFQSVFKMSYADFTTLPQWKQQNMKKANKLF